LKSYIEAAIISSSFWEGVRISPEKPSIATMDTPYRNKMIKSSCKSIPVKTVFVLYPPTKFKVYSCSFEVKSLFVENLSIDKYPTLLGNSLNCLKGKYNLIGNLVRNVYSWIKFTNTVNQNLKNRTKKISFKDAVYLLVFMIPYRGP